MTWSHFKRLIYLDDTLKREFYTEMCRLERWSTRALDKKIGSMLFERTALSRKPAKLAALELKQLRDEDRLSPDLVFRDPVRPKYSAEEAFDLETQRRGLFFTPCPKKMSAPYVGKMIHKAALELEIRESGTFKPGQNGVDSKHFVRRADVNSFWSLLSKVRGF